MPTINIPFGEWLPSQPTFQNPGCEIADNVIPTPGGYGPFPAFVGAGDTATEAVQGADRFYTSANVGVTVGGSNTNLFTVRAGTLTETGGLNAIGTGEAWDFAQYNDFIFATGAGNAPQYLSDIDSDDTWSAAPGSPPIAKRCARIGDFLVLGNLVGEPNAIQWSRFNDPTGTWGTDRRSQAGKVFLPAKNGPVQRVTSGRYPLVFQERGIIRPSYVGPPGVWRMDPLTEELGTPAPFSVVTVRDVRYFLAQDGFYATNGSEINPIGSQRVNRWFFETLSQSEISRVHGAVDWPNESVVWSFPEDGTVFNRKLIYSWAQNRWSTATITTDWLVEAGADATTLEEIGALFPSLEDVTPSLDSQFWQATYLGLSGFAGGEYGQFGGTPMEATWRTGSFQPAPKQRVFVSEVTPDIETPNWDMTCRLHMTDNRGATTSTNAVPVGWSGFAPVRGEGQKMAVEVVKPAGEAWSGARGAQVRYETAGFR